MNEKVYDRLYRGCGDPVDHRNIGICRGKNTYNKLVDLNEQVKEKWSQVENVYQRRLDLIPNLVATVQGYAIHEQETLTAVTEARSKAGGTIQAGADVLNNPEAFQQFQAAQNSLSGALSRLMVVVERYPDLKANEGFLALQSQLEGTENRITVERSALTKPPAYSMSRSSVSRR